MKARSGLVPDTAYIKEPMMLWYSLISAISVPGSAFCSSWFGSSGVATGRDSDIP